MAAPAIRPRSRWQPPTAGSVDPDHPLSQGLVGWWTHTGTDLMGLLPLVPTGISHATGMFGRGVGMTAANASLAAVALPAHKIGPPATVVAVITKTASAVGGVSMFGTFPNDGATPTLGLALMTSNSNQIYAATNSGAGLITGTPSTLANGPHVVVGTFTPTSIGLWVDGNRISADVVALAPAYPGTSWVSAGPGFADQAGRTANMTFHAGSIYRRVLSPVEIAMLHADPYCMIRP